MNARFSQIAESIEKAERILVASHIRPVGEALGSTIAMALWIKELGKTVTAWNEHGVTPGTNLSRHRIPFRGHLMSSSRWTIQ